ncbi:substrate-binding domain-containing protein [Streptomyces sp. NPDC127079]|uniref:substrate-binding domain-containing protein n=1 Tax=Streptomyces sp. NPDC127079 TaxID=3347132 RepID=UPI0036650A80
MGLGIGPAGARRGSLARDCLVVAIGAGLVRSAAGGDDGGSGGDRLSVGVRLPGGGASRCGQFDRPLIEQELKRLGPHGPAQVVAATPDADVQQQQLKALIIPGVSVLVVAAIDPKVPRSSVEVAHLAGIPVVTCDRLARGPRPRPSGRMAVALGRGEPVSSVATGTTGGTIKDTLVKDGIYRIDQTCTPKIRSACAKAGLTR